MHNLFSDKVMLKYIFGTGLLILFLILLGTQAHSQSHVSGQLISEVTSIQPGKSFWLALRVKMDERWHIYWRNPGDTGLETALAWQLPDGLTAGEAQYPYPERIAEPPMVIYGYHGEIYLLTEIRVAENAPAQGKVLISAKVNWLECAEVCIPGETEVQIELPLNNEISLADERWLQTFADARAKLPLKSSEWKFSAALDDEHFIIQAEPPSWFNDEVKGVYFFPYDAEVIKYSADQSWTKKGRAYHLKMERFAAPTTSPRELKGVLFSETGWRGLNSEKALEINIPLTETLLTTANGEQSLSSLWLALLFSFLGGVILNLMPCVLPVLSIKIMGVINQAHDEHTEPWKHGLVFTLGVLVSFWILAGALLILKASGAQLGWGFQLQSPVFLILLSVFMFLFGLSMFGVFEIGTSLTTVGGKTQGFNGWLGSFISGITATIVATPCTAPFMGSALGFALTQPAWVSLLVFTFLGSGMAAPFVLLSSVPALMKFIPKPGRWMESLKQFMGFLLAATVIWLLWVLGLQAGTNALALVLFNLLIVAVAAWIYGRWGNLAMPGRTRIISVTTALILILVSTGYTIVSIDEYAVSSQQNTAQGEGIQWQPFSEESVQQALAQGRPVFIDFTAAWCLSCQVNERVGFSPKEVQDKFKEKGIIAFKADWTSRDEKITQALAKFGRNSVPLYVLYSGKKYEPPIMLPEIITPGIILDALNSVQ